MVDICITQLICAAQQQLAARPRNAPTRAELLSRRLQQHTTRNRVFRVNRRPQTLGAASEEQSGTLNELKRTANLDRLIDAMIASKGPPELVQLVAENFVKLDQAFWLRIATRSDTAADSEEKARLAALAQTVMHLVDATMQKTKLQLDESAKVLQEILAAAADKSGEWHLPLAKERLAAMRQAVEQRTEVLDEAFLSNAFAWMRKAAGDKAAEGMVELLQKVLQLYAGQALAAHPVKSPVDAALNSLLRADETLWSDMVMQLVESGEVSEPTLMQALQARMEGLVLALPSGSYAQRTQAEYLKELESRAKAALKQLYSS